MTNSSKGRPRGRHRRPGLHTRQSLIQVSLAASREGGVTAAARAVIAVRAGDAAACTASLTDHLARLPRSAAFKERDILRAVSAPGTFVYHLANWRRMLLPLGAAARDLVVGTLA